MTIAILRPGTPPTTQATVEIDEKTVFSQKLMNEHKITSEFYSTTALDITIGDYITHGSENFYLNRLPEITKINSATYQYKCTFESVLYDLAKKLFISTDGLAEYSYSGSATDFVTNIVANLNVTGSGWTVGTVATTDDKLLYFANESCKAALTKVAEAFSLEFSLSGKEISLTASAGTDTAYSFEYGKESGLFKLERQQVSDQNIITKVYGFGGTRNISSDYRSRAKRLVFETGSPAVRYLEKNTANYGVIEGQFTDDDIYPKRTSTLTDVNMVFNIGDSGTDFNYRDSYVEDSTIDFDLNDYLIPGLTAKIAFKSGDMTGIECEIWKYDATNKRIYFNPYSDQDGYTLPFYNGGSPLIPDTGDSYTLLDMEMPASYVTTAETSLQTATQAYLDENCIPQVVYTLEIDPKYIKDNSITLAVGDRITIVDTALSINSLIRISQIEYPLVNVNKIKAVIADFVPYTQAERIVKNTVSNKKNIIEVDKTAEERTRLASLKLHQEKAKTTIPMYQGIYDNGKTYYGNPARRDIVKYDIPDDSPDAGYIFYVAKVNAPSESFSGIVPTNTDYWEKFEAQYASVATDLLFAAVAYIENLGVRFFQGVPVDAGDLAGSVANTRANVTGRPQIDTVTLSGGGTGDSAWITCNGLAKLCNYDTDLPTTAGQFVIDYAGDYFAIGVTVTSDGNDIIFTGDTEGESFSGSTTIVTNVGTLTGSVNSLEALTDVARIDTVTLTGDSGEANILCDGVTRKAFFNDSLTQTATNFVDAYYDDYISGGVVVTSDGADIIFTAQTMGVDFTGSTTITNVPVTDIGAIKIQGNQIWEDNTDAENGAVHINYIGYNGGVSRYRTLRIGNGKGNIIMRVYGEPGGDVVKIDAVKFILSNIPTSSSGLSSGQIWRDGTTLKIV
jgi:hypothetical protein